MKIKSNCLFVDTVFPVSVIKEVAEDSKDVRKAIAARLPSTEKYLSFNYRGIFYAHILGKWCRLENKMDDTTFNPVDIFDYSRMFKQNLLIGDKDLREFYRSLILFGLFEDLNCPLDYNMSPTEQADFKTLLVVNAATNTYFNDGLSFAEFDYRDFYDQIQIYYASNIVVNRNHFVYDYIGNDATDVIFRVYIRGNRIHVMNKERSYFYALPSFMVNELTYLNKITDNMIYSIIASMFNKMYYAEPKYRNSDTLKIIKENEFLVREGIVNYYKRLYKAAHMYYHKEKESDIFPIG